MRAAAAAVVYLAVFCVSADAIRPPVAVAQVRDPDLTWRTIRTRHFAVHYHEPLGMVARRAAERAEEAHQSLTGLLGHRPHSRTHVVVTDGSESSNGSATVLPRNEIRLFATAPEDMGSLSDYDDWLRVLVTHEHAHILHLDNIGGVPRALNKIFGKIYSPNNAQPRWFIEGLATYQESDQTAGGRMRSSMFEMFLRMDALEDRLLTIDQLSHDPDRWPWGSVWYLYGSRFVGFIARRYGDSALEEIAHQYGRQAIPYGLNRIARRVTGKSFVELYEDFLDDQRRHHGTVAKHVQRQGISEGSRLTHHGQSARAPRFLDGDTIVYFVSDGRSESQLRLVDPKTGESKGEMVRVAAAGYPAPHPDGRHVYYGDLDDTREIYFLLDLFRYDRDSGTRQRLTHGLRAAEPDISPDGRRIVFTVNGAGTRHLMIASIEDIEGTSRVLHRSRRFEQVYTPRFSPDGRTVAFSTWRRGGYRDIRLLDVETGDLRDVTHDRAFDQGPAWSPDGRWLYFSSDRTGIPNIYRWELETGDVHQVTNVVGGAYHPAVSPGGERLVYLGYTSHGFDLFGLDLDPATFNRAPPYVDDRPPAPLAQRVEPLESERYSPFRTLLPRAYNLDLSTGAFGQEIGIEFTGQDVVGWNLYEGRLAIPFDQKHVSAALTWSYQRWPIPVHLRLSRRVAPRGGLVVGGENRQWLEDAVSGEIGASYRFRGTFHSETVSAAYTLTYLGKEGTFGGDLDPNDPPPTLPQTGLLARLRLGWSFSNVQRHPLDVTPSAGQSASVALSLADPLIGSDFQSVSLSWSAAQYTENPWLEHHVLAVRYGGGISGGDLNRRGLFSVGGFPDVPLLDGVIDDITLGGVGLRGYAPFSRSGTQFHLIQAEYRFPLVRPQLGFHTLPFFINRMYAGVFVDYGDAFFGELDLGSFRAGTGAELFTEFTLGYFTRLSLRTGFAWGFHQGGGAHYYIHLGVPF